MGLKWVNNKNKKIQQTSFSSLNDEIHTTGPKMKKSQIKITFKKITEKVLQSRRLFELCRVYYYNEVSIRQWYTRIHVILVL